MTTPATITFPAALRATRTFGGRACHEMGTVKLLPGHPYEIIRTQRLDHAYSDMAESVSYSTEYLIRSRRHGILSISIRTP